MPCVQKLRVITCVFSRDFSSRWFVHVVWILEKVIGIGKEEQLRDLQLIQNGLKTQRELRNESPGEAKSQAISFNRWSRAPLYTALVYISNHEAFISYNVRDSVIIFLPVGNEHTLDRVERIAEGKRVPDFWQLWKQKRINRKRINN